MGINFDARNTASADAERAFVLFSSDDKTILRIFYSNSMEKDSVIHNWIIANGFDENRIEYLDISPLPIN